ncbi:MAG: diguanylate cyclase [Pseudomonadota bacterium]
MSEQVEQWKSEYRALLAEQTAQANEAQALQRFMREALQRLLISCLGRTEGWDAQIERVRNSVDQADSAQQFEPVLDSIDRLMRGMMADPYSDPSMIHRLVTELATVRDETVEAMQKFAALAGLVDPQRFAAPGSAPPTAVSNDLAQISQALLVGFKNLSLRHAEAEQFLDEVRDTLAEVASLADADAEHVNAQRDANQTLQNDVNAEVAGLQSAVAASDDLSALRRQVRARFDAITRRMASFRDDEEAKLAVVEARNQSLRNELGELKSKTDALHEQLAEQRALLLLDTLTGVHSRFSYEQRVEEELARAARTGQPLCYSIWDIDYFKAVNDRYGHQVGDAALREVAACLVRLTRATDFVSRIGGEEFVVLLPDTTLPTAQTVVEKLRISVAETSFADAGVATPLTVSCGITEYVPGDTAAQLYERADAALYQAKEAGRNRCEAA